MLQETERLLCLALGPAGERSAWDPGWRQGQLNFTIAGDPVAVPDLAVFAQGTSGALSQLDALPVRTFGPV